jgi:hypothetical protein
MTHFYFHTWRGDERLADESGVNLADQAQAHSLALRGLGEMARDFLHTAPEGEWLGIDIVGSDGAVLERLRLDFSLVRDPPATTLCSPRSRT